MQMIELPRRGLQAGFRQFSVKEYHSLIDMRLLTEDEPFELLDGYLVHKMPTNPFHENTMQFLEDALRVLFVPRGRPGARNRSPCRTANRKRI